MKQTVQRTSRWSMWSGALRAWKTSPMVGIGPGMHQNMWPHVAASPDGDAARGIWPTRLNNRSFSYEAHNDWIQLLEEYGLIGFLLVGTTTVAMAGALLRSNRRAAAAGRADSWTELREHGFPLVTGAGLALMAMAFHSLGDFNLQMPATCWLLAVILGAGLGSTKPRPERAPYAYSENRP